MRLFRPLLRDFFILCVVFILFCVIFLFYASFSILSHQDSFRIASINGSSSKINCIEINAWTQCTPTFLMNKQKKQPLRATLSSHLPGDVLLSQGEIPQLPSALKSLTSVFGMGTGVTSSPLSPDEYSIEGLFLQN